MGFLLDVVIAGLWGTGILSIILIISYLFKNDRLNLAPIANIIISRERKKNKTYRINSLMLHYRDVAIKPSIIATLIPVALVLLLGYILYAKFIFLAVVASGSMFPTLEQGDIILACSFNIDPEEGDILLFKTQKIPYIITHRVYEVTEKGIRTKGDARSDIDPWLLTMDQIQGEVVTIGGSPVVIHDVGEYFLFTEERATRMGPYGSELYVVSKTIQHVKQAGLLIFVICIALYIVFSLTRGPRWRPGR